jgi:actin
LSRKPKLNGIMSLNTLNYERPLIVDIGSSTFRCGWAGDDFPDIIVPSIYVSTSDFLFTSDIIDGLEDIFFGTDRKTQMVGSDALKYQNILRMHEFKKENNFNVFVKFFQHYYDQLKVPEELHYKQPIIIITPFVMSEVEKSKIADIFLEFFKFPSILFIPETQAILATLQLSSGVILNIGESCTYISTIYHGFLNIVARDVFPIAGEHITKYLLNLILSRKSTKKGIYLDEMIAREIKEKLSLCVMDPEGEKKRIKEGLTKYDRMIDLPDGSSLTINFERFELAEPLFHPLLLHIDYIGLDELIAKVIKSWERENWEELLNSIILSGGGSLIPGLNERFKQELQKHFSEKLKDKINIIAASGRENMGWIGASILYSKGQLNKGWIEKKSNIIEPEMEE